MNSSGRQSDEVQKRGKGGQREEEGDNWRHFKSEKDIEAPAPLLPLRIETSGEHNGGYIFLTFEDGERGTMVTNGGIWIFWNKPRQKTRGQKNRGGER